MVGASPHVHPTISQFISLSRGSAHPPEPSLRPAHTMATPLFFLLLLAMFTGSDGAWCVCRSDLSDSMLQKTLDYACGAAADCTPIVQNGQCFNPNTVKAHCSYAANSYFQRKGQAQGACDFGGTATLSSTDPSNSGCTYPSSASTAGTSTGTSTGTGTGTSSPPGSTSTSTPSTGSTFSPPLGGFGPTASTMNPDSSDAAAAFGAHHVYLLLAMLSILAFLGHLI